MRTDAQQLPREPNRILSERISERGGVGCGVGEPRKCGAFSSVRRGRRPGHPAREAPRAYAVRLSRTQGLRRLPWMSALLALAAFALFALAGSPTWLAFRPDRPLASGGWCLVTCHLVHWSPQHLLLNIAAFSLLGSLCERAHRGRYLAFLGAGAVCVPIVACAFDNGIRYYAGLSGLVMGQAALLISLATGEAIRRREMMGAVGMAGMAIALVAKVICELDAGETLFAAAMRGAFVTVPEAHLAGALVGFAAAAAIPCRRLARDPAS